METPDDRSDALDAAFASHPRDWRANRYVYPVLSRRSGGLSIGVNLNPDKACNFDCIYCQVDRTIPPIVRTVDVEILRRELDDMLALALSGRLFDEPPFRDTPAAYRRINDIAFSGDGEPTASPQFLPSVRAAIACKAARGADAVRLVLITDAAYLTRPAVREALALMDTANGEIWAKLDAGTEAYFQQVNRPNVPLRRILDNITDAARIRPVVIQSLWMRVRDEPPPAPEVEAFADRLNEIRAGGGQIALVQLYTIARQTAEPYVRPLSHVELDRVAEHVRRTAADIPLRCFYGAE
ncbi:MAG: radical SAM protein [Phycisphaerae bacterium]|nr:radical SAM protein [Phycisphaerae bacterium]